ncbi:MAG: outer membrane protein assembly factor BamD [Planctomycetota bacterium]|nr:outer membrane protein assembly factor BamD [Planctomycetota bacterium]
MKTSLAIVVLVAGLAVPAGLLRGQNAGDPATTPPPAEPSPAPATDPAPPASGAPAYRLGESGTWVATSAPAPGSDEEAMLRARQLLAENRPRQAMALLDDWLEKAEDRQSPFLAEGYLLRGDAKLALGREYAALKDYDIEVVSRFPGTPEFVQALEREFEIGKAYLNGLRRKFLGLRIDNAETLGQEIMVRINERLPGSRLAETALITLADYYYEKRELKMAAQTYDVFVQLFPQSAERQRAMQRRVYANVARFKGPRYDALGLIEARVLIRDFAQRYPAEAERAGMSDALVARIDESLAAQMLETANWYMTRKDEVSARFTLRRLLVKHPQTVAAQRAIEIMNAKGWELTAPRPAQPTPTTTPGPVAPTSGGGAS